MEIPLKDIKLGSLCGKTYGLEWHYWLVTHSGPEPKLGFLHCASEPELGFYTPTQNPK